MDDLRFDFEAAAREAAAKEAAKDESVLTVSKALALAKKKLEGIRITVEGEISEFSDKPGYKAVYFTLVDEDGALPCLMWKSDFAKNPLQLRRGMLVQVSGSFTLYAAKGRMNFVARTMKLAGEGDLRMKVAELARKLEAEGLMDPARKRHIPRMAMKVAVVTSPRGKAVHDVLRTLRRRSPQVEVYVVGVPVEGEQAPTAIVNGLEVADASDCDVILLVRGGGSYEDLMPFNDERVARAVVACRHPVITGIGHEPDNSIADMVGDLRCSTPTAAAEASALEIRLLSESLGRAEQRMEAAVVQRISGGRERLAALASRPVFTDPNYLLASLSMQLDACADRLAQAIPNALAGNRHALEQAQLRLTTALPGMLAGNRHAFEQARARFASALRGATAPFEGRASKASASLVSTGTHLLDAPRAALAVSAARLQDLSPLSVLSRGYAIAYDEEGHVVSEVSAAAPGDRLAVRVSDGTIDCTVNESNPVRRDPDSL